MATAAHDILSNLGFPPAKPVRGRASIADLFRNRRKRTGIYVLHFADGAYYVGQAVDVVRRYAQHRHTHTDITHIAFKSTTRKTLNAEERQTVQALEHAGFILRNIQLVTFSYAETDFDLLMSPDEQVKWLADPAYHGTDQAERVADPHVRSSYTSKFAQFQQQPHADDVISVLRKYVQTCVPVPHKSEMSFWMVSCMLKKINSQFFYSRLNVGFQSTLEAYVFGNTLEFRWFLTESLAETAIRDLNQPIRKRLREFVNKEHHVIVTHEALTQGGPNQRGLIVQGADAALKMLDNPDFVLACRKFNLGLMQKGPCPVAKAHCFDLADRLLI